MRIFGRNQLIKCKQISGHIQIFAPMGIEGLLKFLEPVIIKEHISSFQGQIAAIDIMSWLYKGCYRCAFELNQNIESNDFLYYIFEMIDLLSYYKIKPICVFDGRYVGKKEGTIDKRKKSKQDNRQRGLEYLKIGNQEEARKYLSRCIIIDERIISTTMKALFTKNVQFIVAPYQSDSQIAKLYNMGVVNFAITEDSDLIVYGVKVALKLNQDGECDYIDLTRWKHQDVDSVFLKEYLKMDYAKRVESAVLAGTDYNHSVKGIGIRKAIKHLAMQKQTNKVIQHLRSSEKWKDKVPQDYEKIVLDSKLIFLFATTYNPFTKNLQFLNPQLLPEYLNETITQQELIKIVGIRYDYDEETRYGRVNARTLQKREIFEVDIKNIFALNVASLQMKELANKERRILQLNARARREEQKNNIVENGQTSQNFSIKTKKKQAAPKVELTEQQKQQLSEMKKVQRQRRFTEFKFLLSNVKFGEESDSSIQDIESSVQCDQKNQKNQKNQKSQKKEKDQQKQKSQNKMEDSIQKEKVSQDNDESSVSIGELEFLNPWAKK